LTIRGYDWNRASGSSPLPAGILAAPFVFKVDEEVAPFALFGETPNTSAPTSALQQLDESPEPEGAEAESNCVAERWGGEQLEANNEPVSRKMLD